MKRSILATRETINKSEYNQFCFGVVFAGRMNSSKYIKVGHQMATVPFTVGLKKIKHSRFLIDKKTKLRPAHHHLVVFYLYRHRCVTVIVNCQSIFIPFADISLVIDVQHRT